MIFFVQTAGRLALTTESYAASTNCATLASLAPEVPLVTRRGLKNGLE